MHIHKIYHMCSVERGMTFNVGGKRVGEQGAGKSESIGGIFSRYLCIIGKYPLPKHLVSTQK